MNFLYVFVSFPFAYCAKVGISDKPGRRLREVMAGIRKRAWFPTLGVCLLALPLINPRYTEVGLQAFLDRWSIQVSIGTSGKTEWFFWPNIFTALLSAGYLFFVGDPCYMKVGAALLLLPLPVDIIIFSLLLALFQYALIGAAIWGMFQFF